MNQAIFALLSLPVAAALSLALGPFAIQYLKRLKMGQFIREEGPESHQKKGGTPTMGGLIFLIPALLVGLLFSHSLGHSLIWIGIILLITSLGAIDDCKKSSCAITKALLPNKNWRVKSESAACLGST